MLKILGFWVTIFNKDRVLLSCVLTGITLPVFVPILPSVLSKYNLSSPPEAFSSAINQTANSLACFKVNNCIQLINGNHNRAGCWIRQPSSHRAISRCPWLSASTNKQVLCSLSVWLSSTVSHLSDRMIRRHALRALLKFRGHLCVSLVGRGHWNRIIISTFNPLFLVANQNELPWL